MGEVEGAPKNEEECSRFPKSEAIITLEKRICEVQDKISGYMKEETRVKVEAMPLDECERQLEYLYNKYPERRPNRFPFTEIGKPQSRESAMHKIDTLESRLAMVKKELESRSPTTRLDQISQGFDFTTEQTNPFLKGISFRMFYKKATSMQTTKTKYFSWEEFGCILCTRAHVFL